MAYSWIILFVPVICLSLLASVACFLFKKWKVGASLLIVGLVLNWLTESIPLNLFSPSKSGESFSVLTYNLHDPGGWLADHRKDPTELRDFILGTDADIVVLEECDRDSAKVLIDMLSESYEYHHDMIPSFRNAIFSRYPLDSFSDVLLYKDGGLLDEHPDLADIEGVRPHFSYSHRLLFTVNARIAGRRINVIGCHFPSNGFNQMLKNAKESGFSAAADHLISAGAQREIEAYCVRKVLDSCMLAKEPVIVCGDLNDFSGSKTLRILQKDGALKDCWWERGWGLGFTFHSHGWMHFRLDHILHTEGLKCTSVKVLKQDISDHDALMATFEFE